MKQEEGFDFLSHIQKDNLYGEMIPEEELGIILFKIIEVSRTAEKHILSELDSRKIISECKANEFRDSHRFTDINIKLLKKHFIKDAPHGYKITQYGKQFYNTIKRKVGKNFKPSEVHTLFLNLRNSIKVKDSFLNWYESDFMTYSEQLQEELESFNFQVVEAVKAFRKSLN